MKLELSDGSAVQIDRKYLPLVKQFTWRTERREHTSYAVATAISPTTGKATTIRMHAVIMGTVGMGRDLKIDHRDGDGLNNRRRNLRKADNFQNVWNKSKKNGYQLPKGVTKLKRLRVRPYQARIACYGNQMHLGYFATASEAARVYDKAAKKFFGRFARTNGKVAA